MKDGSGAGFVARACGEELVGLVRPRPVDHRLLDRIVDVGLPEGHVVVEVHALAQVPRSVPAGSVVEGAGMHRRLPNAMTTFVVEHPEATFLVDPAYCRDARSRVLAELPLLLRLVVTPPQDTVATVDSLGRRPPRRPIDFALPTHAHWDHVCGLLDLPGLPVFLHGREREWALGAPVAPVGGVRSTLADGRPVRDYDLDGPPVSTFTASHDLFADGSVVLVELGGHTPGSVGVLLRTLRGPVLIAGDAAWHGEQVERIRQKPALPGVLVDEDRDAAFAALHRLHLARHRVRVVPTHDHDATAALDEHGAHRLP